MRNDAETVKGSDSGIDKVFIFVEHILVVKSTGLFDQLTSQRKRGNQELLLGFGLSSWVDKSDIYWDGRTGLSFLPPLVAREDAEKSRVGELRCLLNCQ